MKTLHHLLTRYTIMVVLFVILFTFVIYTTNPSAGEVFNMALSIAMFALIPFGLIYLIWRHQKHH